MCVRTFPTSAGISLKFVSLCMCVCVCGQVLARWLGICMYFSRRACTFLPFSDNLPALSYFFFFSSKIACSFLPLFNTRFYDLDIFLLMTVVLHSRQQKSCRVSYLFRPLVFTASDSSRNSQERWQDFWHWLYREILPWFSSRFVNVLTLVFSWSSCSSYAIFLKLLHQ